MVATGQGNSRSGKSQGICAGSGIFEILRNVRQIQENPLKVGGNLTFSCHAANSNSLRVTIP